VLQTFFVDDGLQGPSSMPAVVHPALRQHLLLLLLLPQALRTLLPCCRRSLWTTTCRRPSSWMR
jgi:hypothetical protein